MELGAASETRARRTNAAVRAIRSLVRHAHDRHFSLISNRHLAIRNGAISLKTRLGIFSNRHGSGSVLSPPKTRSAALFQLDLRSSSLLKMSRWSRA